MRPTKLCVHNPIVIFKAEMLNLGASLRLPLQYLQNGKKTLHMTMLKSGTVFRTMIFFREQDPRAPYTGTRNGTCFRLFPYMYSTYLALYVAPIGTVPVLTTNK